MPNPDDLIRTAREAIGSGGSGSDWKIEPTVHADMFADKAPSLAANLRGARVQGVAESYELSDSKAVDARDVFKSKVGRADRAIFCTASLGALLLMAGGLDQQLGVAGPWGVAAIGLLGVLSGGIAAMWINQIKRGDLANRWTNERAKVEGKRLAYFKTVMEGASADPLDQLLALEYTRRFLLDNQIEYFHDRSGQHAGEADRALERSTRAMLVASILTATAGLLSALIPQMVVIAGLGVIASAYAAWAASRSALNLDRRNADRYRVIEDRLRDRRLDLDAYRARVAAADEGALQEFFEPVFQALQADHRAFLSDAEQRELAIGEMAKRLATARER